MSVAKGIGPSERVAVYELPDDELPAGSTLGGPRVMAIVKANGSIEKVYGTDSGAMLLGTLILRHYDAVTGMYLTQDQPGTFGIHPERQEHAYVLQNGVAVHNDIFVLRSRGAEDEDVDPPGVYQIVELRNRGEEAVEIATYAFAVLRGDTGHDVVIDYDKKLHALVVWNESQPDLVRVLGCSEPPESYETTLDYAKAVSESFPGMLSGETSPSTDPLGVIHHCHRIDPGEAVRFSYLISCGAGRKEAARNYRACPPADRALSETQEYFRSMLKRSVVLAPDPQVNRGVLWAKANMLRLQTRAPTGWCFVNDPTRSNNSVGRDTAWFGFGADYVTPEFARDSLLAYVRLQEKSGMFVEYYDIRNRKTEDYGLNINDGTPLLIMALWHHYNATGDEDFLREVYPAAERAARYILSQRNDQGLVWCTADGTEDWGICSWRNVIPNYRLSGAVTEVNAECYSALLTVSHMSRVLEQHDVSAELAREADDLRTAINEHLTNPNNGLYYLNIDLDGNPRTDVTCDLVFPVMFGVADDDRAARIIARLSNDDFWTQAGMRTVPRDSPMYTPNLGWGLLGGVWVAVSFWYAFAAARYSPEFMAHALSTSFQNYSDDPLRHNTVPGQFSEWLDGETLVNRGMMLSPWFPPRYLWAAIEGMGGLDFSRGSVLVHPRLAPEWKWLGVQNLPFRNASFTWVATRMRDGMRIYTNFPSSHAEASYVSCDEDISDWVETTGRDACSVAFRQEDNVIMFVGNTNERTVNTCVRVHDRLSGAYRLRRYNSLVDRWEDDPDLIPAEQLHRGLIVKLERKGYCLLDLRQEV